MIKISDSGGAKAQLPVPSSKEFLYYFALSAQAPVATPQVSFIVYNTSALAATTATGVTAANRLAYVHRVKVTGAATAAGTMPIVVTKYKGPVTAGGATVTNITAAKVDTDAPSPVVLGAAKVTVTNLGNRGTAIATIASGRLEMTALGSGVGVEPYVLEFPKPLVLRPDEQLQIAFGGAAVPSGGVIDYEVVASEAIV